MPEGEQNDDITGHQENQDQHTNLPVSVALAMSYKPPTFSGKVNDAQPFINRFEGYFSSRDRGSFNRGMFTNNRGNYGYNSRGRGPHGAYF
jgi:hypothetical protein